MRLTPEIPRRMPLSRFVRKARHACALSSGTAALHLALRALGVGPGDEVIVPDLTYIAVANAVIYCGATPVPVDVHEDYWCLDPDRVAEEITVKTRALVAVHGFGHPADMDRILSLAGSRGIPVIEDSSQAFGARYKGKRAGGLGAISVHSFYANKILTTGEGGALVTEDPEIAARAALLRNHCESSRAKFLHESVGFNYRMTNLQAAIGCAQLERVEDILDARSRLLSWYREDLGHIPDAILNPAQAWADPVNWLVCFRLLGRPPARLEAFRERMARYGVEVRPNFVPLHLQPSMVGLARIPAGPGAGAVSRRLASGMVMFPSGSGLTRGEVASICDAIKGELE